jgi:hypothetical protein
MDEFNSPLVDWCELLDNVTPQRDELLFQWPACLPKDLIFCHPHGLDEHKIVVPSWNSAPCLVVVRARRAVAIVHFRECGMSDVRWIMEFPTIADAQAAFAAIYDDGCRVSREIFDELSEDEKSGALV